jgi:hypothetical protein
MGIADNVRAIQLPSPKQILGSYKEAKQTVQRIDTNTINVRFWPKNSPFFHDTKGNVFHFTKVSLLKIEVPEQLGWIIQDDSISFSKNTKEEWVECRQDYPLTLSVNARLKDAIIEAMRQFPEIENWYIPTSINKIPVKNIIIKYSKDIDEEAQKEINKVGVSRSLTEWINNLPTEIEITAKFLYDFADIQIFQSMKEDKTRGGMVLIFMGFLMGAIVSMGFITYLGR